jgi:hypothetical protein
MCRSELSASFRPTSIAMFLPISMISTQAQAQTPSAGTSVMVRMVEAIDWSKDPAGKQHRASIAKAVDVGDGATRTGSPHIDFPPLIFSGDGTRLAWVWPKPDGVSKDVISIDGQEIMHGYRMYEFPEFSPDSKHFATMIRNANKYALAVDGTIGPGYDEFLEVNPNVARFLDSHTFRLWE